MKTIAFDFDDVIYQTSAAFLEFNIKKYKVDVAFEELGENFYENLQISLEEEDKRWDLFFKDKKYGYLKPERKIIRFFKKLKRNYKLIIVTAREDVWQYHLKNWINLYMKDIFEEVVFLDCPQNKGKTKGDICKDKNCSLFIDDNTKHIKSCFKLQIDTILYNQPWNKNYKKKIKRIDSILDLKNILKNL